VAGGSVTHAFCDPALHPAFRLRRLIRHETKAELVSGFIDVAVTLARARRHCAPYLAALGGLLNRAPLHGGPETVVSPDLVEHAYSAFRGFDWAEPELLELQTLFLRAARVIGDRSLDVHMPLRGLIAGKMEKSGVSPLQAAKIRGFMPVGRSDRDSLYDESLPPGLVLGPSTELQASWPQPQKSGLSANGTAE
jgi:hypothetical protein